MNTPKIARFSLASADRKKFVTLHVTDRNGKLETREVVEIGSSVNERLACADATLEQVQSWLTEVVNEYIAQGFRPTVAHQTSPDLLPAALLQHGSVVASYTLTPSLEHEAGSAVTVEVAEATTPGQFVVVQIVRANQAADLQPGKGFSQQLEWAPNRLVAENFSVRMRGLLLKHAYRHSEINSPA